MMRILLFACAALLGTLAMACEHSLEPGLDGACDFEADGYCWQHLGLENTWVTTVADTPWGLFAGTHREGVYRLNDGTSDWKFLGLDHSIVGDLLFVSSDTSRLLVGMRPYADEQTAAAVFATEDGGATWLPWDGGLAQVHDNRQWAWSLAMDPGNPERLFMGQSGSILRSDDGGDSWAFLTGGPDISGAGVHVITVSPRRDGHIWAGRQTVFSSPMVDRSKDWGESWDHINLGRHDGSVNDFAVHETDPDTLWSAELGRIQVSADAGKTWRTIFVPERPAWVNGIIHANFLYAATSEEVHHDGQVPEHLLGLYRSHDEGETWDTLTVPDGAEGASDLKMDEEGSLLIPTRNGLWRVEPIQ